MNSPPFIASRWQPSFLWDLNFVSAAGGSERAPLALIATKTRPTYRYLVPTNLPASSDRGQTLVSDLGATKSKQVLLSTHEKRAVKGTQPWIKSSTAEWIFETLPWRREPLLHTDNTNLGFLF